MYPSWFESFDCTDVLKGFSYHRVIQVYVNNYITYSTTSTECSTSLCQCLHTAETKFSFQQSSNPDYYGCMHTNQQYGNSNNALEV